MSDDVRALNQLVDEDGGLLKLGYLTEHVGTNVLVSAIKELYGMVWYLAEESVEDFISEKNHSDKRVEYVKEALTNYVAGLELSPTERYQPLDYDGMIVQAAQNESYRQGLLDAARVARAQGTNPTKPPCPSEMVAVYLDRLANGERP